jgi:DNA (cytosine-5)-methyltransferase 1
MRYLTLDLTVTDEFCGAGGSSDGVHKAGATVRLAMNHSERAIETHQTNFPDTDHALQDVARLNPRKFPRTDILIASPDCRSHTYARGRARAEQQEPLFELDVKTRRQRAAAIRSRATMWQVLRWAAVHDYEGIIAENVGEVVDWLEFDAWLRAADRLGYRVQFCWFNSMFFGGAQDDQDDGRRPPQSRDRLYLVLTKKGNPTPDLEFRPRAWCSRCQTDIDAYQRFKDPSRRRPMRYRRQYDYRCPSCNAEALPYVAPAAAAIDWAIPTTPIGARTRPLKDTTLRRIEEGLRRHGWLPALVPVERTSRQGRAELKPPRAVTDPMRTQTGRAETGVMIPFVAELRRNGTGRSVSDPLATMVASGTHHALIQPPEAAGLVVSNYSPGWVRPADLPVGAITGRDHHALLIPVNGHVHDPGGTGRRVRGAGEPFPTQTGDKEHALLELPGVFIDDYNGSLRQVAEPLPTQTSIDGNALVMLPDGLLVQVGGNTFARPGSTCRTRPTSEPMRAQTSTLSEALVQLPPDFLLPYKRTNIPRWVGEPMGTVTSVEHSGLLSPAELIEACGFRMLTWYEIRAAMAFRDDYVLTGNKTDKVRQLGQAVTPPVMTWIFRRVADSLARARSAA